MDVRGVAAEDSLDKETRDRFKEDAQKLHGQPLCVQGYTTFDATICGTNDKRLTTLADCPARERSNPDGQVRFSLDTGSKEATFAALPVELRYQTVACYPRHQAVKDKKGDTVVSMDELVTMMQSMKLQDLIWSRGLDAAEEDLMQLISRPDKLRALR